MASPEVGQRRPQRPAGSITGKLEYGYADNTKDLNIGMIQKMPNEAIHQTITINGSGGNGTVSPVIAGDR